jgi:hypothetical protein
LLTSGVFDYVTLRKPGSFFAEILNPMGEGMRLKQTIAANAVEIEEADELTVDA